MAIPAGLTVYSRTLYTKADADTLIKDVSKVKDELPAYLFPAGELVESSFGKARVVTVELLEQWLEAAKGAQARGQVAYIYERTGMFGANPPQSVRPFAS